MPDRLSKIRLSRQSSMRQQLSHQLREMIVTGQMNEGDRLPSNQALADKWKVAASSVQAAMASLVKEGLLQRARKRGTFVAKRSSALTHVAIYLAEDIWHMRAAAFRRAVVTSLSEQLRRRHIQPVVWSDSRPPAQQSEPWIDLIRAAEQRQVQAVLMCSGKPANRDWLSKLAVPLVSLTTALNRNCVGVDNAEGERLAARHLAKIGCRSVGIISPVRLGSVGSGIGRSAAAPGHAFQEQAIKLGLDINDDWVRTPGGEAIDEPEAERFGYDHMRAVLKQSIRPDGLFVTYDWVARGALMAVLESGVKVPKQLKLVLHRNVEVGLLCPVKAAFLDFRVADVAAAMIDLMDAQRRGEECESVRIHPRISTV